MNFSKSYIKGMIFLRTPFKYHRIGTGMGNPILSYLYPLRNFFIRFIYPPFPRR